MLVLSQRLCSFQQPIIIVHLSFSSRGVAGDGELGCQILILLSNVSDYDGSHVYIYIEHTACVYTACNASTYFGPPPPSPARWWMQTR